MSPEPSKSPSEERPKTLALVIGLVITLVLLMLVIRAGLQASWRSEGNAVLAELSAEGLGVDDLFPEPPAKNGAPQIRRAFALIDPLPDRLIGLPGARPSILKAALADPTSEGAWTLGTFETPAELEAAVLTILAKLEEAQPHLDKGLSREIVYLGDWEKGFQADLPFLMEVKQLVNVLCLRAGWRSAKGDAPGAYADLERSLLLTRSLKLPQLITRLVQIAVCLRSLEILEDLLNGGPKPEAAQQARLLALLNELEQLDGMTPSLRGELQAFSVMSDSVPLLGSDEQAPAGSSFLWGYWRKEHLKEMAALIRASQKPADEFRTYVAEFEERLPKEGNTLSQLLMPAVARVVTKNQTCRARLRLAIWGLELAQWDELPAQATGAPKDPFTLDSEPCGYKREGRGVLLWSIGEDGRDSKGAGADMHGIEGGPDDLSFRLLRR